TNAVSPPLTLYNMTIYSNTASNGNGGGVYAAAALSLVGGSIYSNTSIGNGGGVYAINALMTMTNVTVAGNTSDLYGAGVMANAGANISDSRFENNRVIYDFGRGAGLHAGGVVMLSGGEFRGNRVDLSPNGLFALKVVTVTASVPYTYSDPFDLVGDLAVSGNFTFTPGVVNFVEDPNAPTTVVTHTLRSADVTWFDKLAVTNYSVLDVGSADVQVTGIFTNAGVINRLAPTQTIAA